MNNYINSVMTKSRGLYLTIQLSQMHNKNIKYEEKIK